MDKSLQEALNRAKTYLVKKEFNEGLAVLEDWSDEIPEVELMRQRIEQAKIKEIDSILREIEEARVQNDQQAAFDLIRKAESLDSSDSRVRSAMERMRNAFTAERHEEKVLQKKQSAAALLKRPGKSLEDLDKAIHLLEEVTSDEPGDIDAESLLTEAQQVRSEFLKSKGQIATLEQAGEFEAALKEINDLIARGFNELDGKNIYEVRSQLEKKAREFAEQKAAKYLKKAEDALKEDNNPQLAMRYIDMGLSLPGIPKTRRDAFNDLKIGVEQAIERFKEVDRQVQEARGFMDRQQYEQAISKLEDALARIPRHIQAQTFLKLARDGLKDRIIKDARLAIARVESGLNKSNLQKSREDLLAVLEQLDLEDGKVENLRAHCNEVLEQINLQEQKERILEEAVDKAQQALKENRLEAAQWEIEALDKELQKRPEVIKIRTALTRKQDIEDALGKVKQALEEENLDSAHKQVVVLKRRVGDHKEVERLYKEIKSTLLFKKGIEDFNDGTIKEATKGFKQVVSLDALHAEEAREYLQRIEALSEKDRKATQLYNTALKHSQAQRFNEAYHILAEIEDIPSSVKSQINALRSSVRSKWRSQLIKQIRSCLKIKSYDEIIDLAKGLKEVGHAEDTKLINEVYKHHYIYQAEIAEKRQNWLKALQYWEDAQKYDALDEHINKGLTRAKKNKLFREAEAARNDQEVIRILEEVVDRRGSELTDLDFKIEERLYQAYLVIEDFPRAMGFAGTRLGLEAAFAAKARIVRELCFQLIDSKEKLQVGAFAESLDILCNCQEKYPEYSECLQGLCQRRKKQIIDTLLNEARELEIKGENEVHILAKYRELLQLMPQHREAKQCHDTLLDRFRQNVDETIQEGVSVREDENAALEEIDSLILRIHQLMSVANDSQKTRLKSQLDNLTRKRQTVKHLNKKLTQLEAFLTEAKESGDFKVVDRELNEIADIASHRNHAYSKLVDRIRDIKDRRSQCVEKVEEMVKAFKTLDFSSLERLVDELRYLDGDDEFFIQRRRLIFEDSNTNQKIGFKELKEWARTRRQNLEKLEGWFKMNGVDPGEFVEAEQLLRKEAESDFDKRKFALGLQRLAAKYKNRVGPLMKRPESPLSQPAQKIVEHADTLIKELGEKARQLEEEAQSITQDEERLEELVQKASILINKGDYSNARIYVEEGLDILPTHEILRHFKKLVNNAR